MSKFSKPDAVAMLGHTFIKKLIPLFKDRGITLEDKEYMTSRELQEAIAGNAKLKYVLIADSALLGVENGVREIVKQIRNINSDVIIVLLLSYEEPSEAFQDWAYGYRVYHIYYGDGEKKGFDFSLILHEMQNKDIPMRGKSVDGDIQEAIQEKEKELNSVTKKLDDAQEQIQEKDQQIQQLKAKLANQETQPVKDNTLTAQLQEQLDKVEQERNQEKLAAQKLMSEKEALSKAKDQLLREKEAEITKLQTDLENALQQKEEEVTPPLLAGTLLIGITSVSSGAGATTTCVELAKVLSQNYLTAVVPYDGSPDLMSTDIGYADLFIPKSVPSGRKDALSSAMMGGYQFILIDFGNLYKVQSDGSLEPALDMEEHMAITDEFLRCQYKISIGFNAPWHLQNSNITAKFLPVATVTFLPSKMRFILQN